MPARREQPRSEHAARSPRLDSVRLAWWPTTSTYTELIERPAKVRKTALRRIWRSSSKLELPYAKL